MKTFISNFLLAFLLILPGVLSSKHNLEDYSLAFDSFYAFDRYIFTNSTSYTEGIKQAEFNYNLTITTRNNKYDVNGSSEQNTFHIYLIKSNIIPYFDLLSNPAICCSIEGGIICDEDFDLNYRNSTGSEYKLLKTYALYYKNYKLENFVEVKSDINIQGSQSINEEGIVYTLLMLCSNQINKTPSEAEANTNFITLNGVFSYSNPDGYLSADEALDVDIYLFFSLFYFILSIFWVYKMIMNFSKIKIFNKMLTLTLPIIILEKMMNVQIYFELNRYGEYNYAFEILLIICNILKNVSYRILFFGLSTGYSVINRKNSKISCKKYFNFSIVLSFYFVSAIISSLKYSDSTSSEFILAFQILSLFFLHLADCYLFWKIYRGFKKQTNLSINNSLSSPMMFYQNLLKVFKFILIIFAVYLIMLITGKVFPNYQIVWKTKWITNLLSEIVSLLVFLSLVWFLQSSYLTEDGITLHELEADSQMSNYNESTSRSVEIK